MKVVWRLVGLLLAGWALWACQSQDDELIAEADDHEARPTLVETAAAPATLSWDRAADCRGMLAILHEGLESGHVHDLAGTPFAFLNRGGTAGTDGWFKDADRVSAGQVSSLEEARCIIRVGRALDRDSGHQVLSQETVRSRYKSGTTSEKNPAYEVAKVRLRQAEKAAKPSKSSLMKIDDPLLDLVGTLVGGALNGLGQWGAGDQLEEALNTLIATPPRIERPKYKNYQYELRHISARREATIPVILTDRRLARSWEVSLKQREQRHFAVITGLDPQDENYTRLRQENMTEQRFQRWLTAEPSLALADVTAGLLDRPSSIPLDRLALVSEEQTPSETAALASGVFFDAAASPAAQPSTSPPANHSGQQSSAKSGRASGKLAAGAPTGGSRQSRANIVGEVMRAEGVFVAPHFILTPSEIIGDRGLVDIEDRPGHAALGLVAAIDHGLGLALIQSPMPGLPMAVGAAGIHTEPFQQNDELQRPYVSEIPAPPMRSGDGEGPSPWIVDGKLLGFRMANGPDITDETVHRFLDRQRHLLPTEN